MRKILSLLLIAALLCAIPIGAFAADTGMSFNYELTVDGKTSVIVEPNDVVTVTLTLTRTDSSQGFPMYAVQSGLRYSSDLFELVPGSITFGKDASTGITVNTRELSGGWDGWTSISASAYSDVLEGNQWNNSVLMMTFRLKALRVGTSTIFARDYTVGTSDGMDSYVVTTNDVTVTVKSAAPSTENNDNNGSDGNPSDNSGSLGSGSSGTQKPNEEQTDAPPAVERRFSDVVTGSWYEEAVNYAVDAGLFNGTSDTSFSPDGVMTRAMLMTVLWRLDGRPDSSGKNAYSDVEHGAWYTDAVIWASENEITGGYGNGLFGTNDSITREQLAAILYRYARYKEYDIGVATKLDGFSDVGRVSEWARAPMEWAVGTGIITGIGGNTLAPEGTATRAQVAVMLMRFSNLHN